MGLGIALAPKLIDIMTVSAGHNQIDLCDLKGIVILSAATGNWPVAVDFRYQGSAAWDTRVTSVRYSCTSVCSTTRLDGVFGWGSVSAVTNVLNLDAVVVIFSSPFSLSPT